MKQTKPHYMGFRTTDEQAAKLSRIADRAGVDTSEIMCWLIERVEDPLIIHPNAIRMAQGKPGEATLNIVARYDFNDGV